MGERLAPSSPLPPPSLPLPELNSAAFPLDSLPAELIAHILSFLPLGDLIHASQTCAVTYEIASSSLLSPWAGPIAVTVEADPCPEALRRLGCYSYVPRSAFLPILVQARPQFLAGPFEMPVGLRERDWEEAMRQRFLPSWLSEQGNWRREGMKWRELFMRAIQRIAHRSVSTCTTEESYTRWVTLDRRGSATLNRVRAQGFDPLDVFREIKLQNNLHHLPTTVRHLVDLQDVHILVVGVLHSPTSLFLNANAHALLHPPLCYPQGPRVETRRPWELARDREARVAFQGRERSMSEGGESALMSNGGHDVVGPAASRVDSRDSTGGTTSTAAGGSAGRLKKFGIPLSRTISGGGSSSRSAATDTQAGGTKKVSLGSTVASFLKPRAHPNSSAFSIGTHLARSRDLISSEGTLAPVAYAPLSAAAAPAPQPPLPHRTSTSRSNGHARTRTQETSEPVRLPYKPMRHPQPAEGWRLYPNWTPGGQDTRRRPDGERFAPWEREVVATNGDAEGVVDDEDEDEEWAEVVGTKAWVGPMMIIAALRTPRDGPSYFPTSSTGMDRHEHGHHLLPRAGGYASFEWDDLWAIAPWLKDEERVGNKIGGGVGFLRNTQGPGGVMG